MQKVRYILYCLSLAFAITGLAFLFFPNQLLHLFNYTGQILGDFFVPLADGANRFWSLFAFAYMVLVTTLTYAAARQVARSRLLLQFLILGKVSTSLCGLALFLLEIRAAGYLLTFVVDGVIALIFCWCLYVLDKEQSHGGK